MVERIKKVTKGKVTRERKRIVVIGTEGNNKTEVLYFRELERKQNRYHCIFAQGNETDPIGIIQNTIKKADEEELRYHEGDMAISIFDLDLDKEKCAQLQIATANAEKPLMIVTSNPCFEVWYLEHFGFSTKPFVSSNAAIKELEKRIPGYQKNRCDMDLLYPKTKEAIRNCERLDKYHKDNDDLNVMANPRTDVYKVVRDFIGERGDKEE